MALMIQQRGDGGALGAMLIADGGDEQERPATHDSDAE
jgi:hypothetical protein